MRLDPPSPAPDPSSVGGLRRLVQELPSLEARIAWEAGERSGLGPVRAAFFDPRSRRAHLGFGSLLRLTPPLEAADRAGSTLLEQLSDPRPELPLAFFSFPFDRPWAGWPVGLIEVPRAILSLGARSATLSVLAGAPEDAHRAAEALMAEARRPPVRSHGLEATPKPLEPDQAFLGRLEQLLGSLEAGDAEKVVVARAARLETAEPASARATYARLLELEPEAMVYAIAGGEGDWLVGATPELLARVEGDRLFTMALAGTRRRAADPARDQAEALALLRSAKDAAEHATVVRSILDKLGRISVEAGAEARELLRSPRVQHLLTPISAALRPGVSLLSAVAALHPTPAVLGYPEAAARAWLQREEPWVRGAYAGPVGFLDGRGGGVAAVALRCGRLEPTGATAFAGAGIVRGSVAAEERREIEAKLEVFARALAAVTEARA
ncbi:MAG: chorismate-binding protein [Myxococcota bacterium]